MPCRVARLSGTDKLQAERALGTFQISPSFTGIILQTLPGNILVCSSKAGQAAQLLSDFLHKAQLHHKAQLN